MKRTLVVLFAISFVACSMNYEKTPSGLAYKIFRGNGDRKTKSRRVYKI